MGNKQYTELKQTSLEGVDIPSELKYEFYKDNDDGNIPNIRGWYIVNYDIERLRSILSLHYADPRNRNYDGEELCEYCESRFSHTPLTNVHSQTRSDTTTLRTSKSNVVITPEYYTTTGRCEGASPSPHSIQKKRLMKGEHSERNIIDKYKKGSPRLKYISGDLDYISKSESVLDATYNSRLYDVPLSAMTSENRKLSPRKKNVRFTGTSTTQIPTPGMHNVTGTTRLNTPSHHKNQINISYVTTSDEHIIVPLTPPRLPIQKFYDKIVVLYYRNNYHLAPYFFYYEKERYAVISRYPVKFKDSFDSQNYNTTKVDIKTSFPVPRNIEFHSTFNSSPQSLNSKSIPTTTTITSTDDGSSGCNSVCTCSENSLFFEIYDNNVDTNIKIDMLCFVRLELSERHDSSSKFDINEDLFEILRV